MTVLLKEKSTTRNKEYVQGHYKNDMRNGHGTFTYADGSIFIGDWINDHKSGYGDYSSSTGSRYQFSCSKALGSHFA